jgi:hypothetical protein
MFFQSVVRSQACLNRTPERSRTVSVRIRHSGTHRCDAGPSGIVGVLLVLLLLIAPARGQCQRWLPGQSFPGINGTVSALVVLPGASGDVIAGGTFVTAGGVPANYIARFSPTTGLWSPLGSGVNATVNALALLADGQVLVGGSFTTAGGSTANRVARYNPTTGTWSALGTGTNNPVNALAVLPDGDILVGGSFGVAGGVTANRIARFRPATGVWSSLNVGSGLNDTVNALAVLPSGDFLAGGLFTTAGGVPANRIARYNPTTGTWSAVGSGIAGLGFATVNALLILPVGSGSGTAVEVIVGGAFSSANGVAANNIARYNPGTGTFTPIRGGTSSSVSSLALLPDAGSDLGSAVIVGGNFANADGLAVNNVARFSTASGAWSALGTGTNGVPVNTVAVLPDGDVVAGGQFSMAGGVTASSIARVNPASGQWSALGSGLNNAVKAMAVLAGGDIIAAGTFTSAGGVALGNIGRFNPTTGVWSALGPGTNGSVNAVAVRAGPTGAEQLYVGGFFTSAGGVAVSNVARYDLATGQWAPLGGGTNGTVNAMLVLPDGHVLAGGSFSMAGGAAAQNVARFVPASGLWSPLGTGTEIVNCLMLHPSGEIYFGGTTYLAGDLTASSFGRYNPATGLWWQTNFNGGAVFALATLADGSVLVGGSFERVSEVVGFRLARFNPATEAWSAFGMPFEGFSVRSIVTTPAGDLLIGGTFTRIGSQPTVNITRYSAATGTWTALGAGVNRAVNAMAVLPGGDVAVGGLFTAAGGNPSAHFARTSFGDPSLRVTSDPSSQTVCPSGSVSLSVTATGISPLSYRWMREGTPINPLTNPSAATATLTLTNVTSADATSYDCIVTNACGSVTSNPATLTLAAKCSPADIVGTDGGPVQCADSTVDGSDFIAFINSFSIGDATIDPLADIAGGGDTGEDPDGTIDGTDFIAFINAFAIGC